MSLPSTLRASTTPSELELLACQDMVEIVPLISMEKTAFISGNYGPLRPPVKANIPIWMAINLKLKKKCHIIAPNWLSVEYLTTQLKNEIAGEAFSLLPFSYSEISKVLLDVASDDIQDSDQLRSLLKDLREARQARCRNMLHDLNPYNTDVTGMTRSELNEMRPFVLHAAWVASQLDREFDKPLE